VYASFLASILLCPSLTPDPLSDIIKP
jgi:hypothetical protein